MEQGLFSRGQLGTSESCHLTLTPPSSAQVALAGWLGASGKSPLVPETDPQPLPTFAPTLLITASFPDSTPQNQSLVLGFILRNYSFCFFQGCLQFEKRFFKNHNSS